MVRMAAKLCVVLSGLLVASLGGCSAAGSRATSPQDALTAMGASGGSAGTGGGPSGVGGGGRTGGQSATTTSATPGVCVPGASVACACVTGQQGAQTCTSAGTFAACVCPVPGGDTGVVPDGAVQDSAPAATTPDVSVENTTPDAGTQGRPDLALALRDTSPPDRTVLDSVPDLAPAAPDTPAKIIIGISGGTTLGSTPAGVPGLVWIYTVTNMQGPPTGPLGVSVDNAVVVIASNTCGASLAQWDTCSVGLQLSPASYAALGTVTATMRVAWDDDSASVTVQGTVVAGLPPPDAQAIPDAGPPDGATDTGPPTTLSASTSSGDSHRADFGSNTLGEASTNIVYVYVTNSASTATGVLSMVLSGPGSTEVFHYGVDSCSGSVLAPGKTCSFSLYYQPRDLAGVNGLITVTDGTVSVSIPMVGTATLADSGAPGSPAQLSPVPSYGEEVSFGCVEIGTTSAVQLATIVNSGGTSTGALIVSPWAFGGVGCTPIILSSNDCQGIVLASGATCSFGVQYQPTSPDYPHCMIQVHDGSASANDAGVYNGGVLVGISACPGQW
jgi:hypothetical protein